MATNRRITGYRAITCLHIEQAATDPEASGDWLTSRLGLARHEGLFAGADINVLNRWATKVTTSERAQLDVRLGDWAVHFGYDPDNIGRRTGPAVSQVP